MVGIPLGNQSAWLRTASFSRVAFFGTSQRVVVIEVRGRRASNDYHGAVMILTRHGPSKAVTPRSTQSTSVICANHPKTLRRAVPSAGNVAGPASPTFICTEPARVANTSRPGSGFGGVLKR